MNLSMSQINLKTNLRSKENINQQPRNAKHFFDFIYHLYNINGNGSATNKLYQQEHKWNKFTSLINQHKLGFPSLEKKQELFANTKNIMRNKQRRSESDYNTKICKSKIHSPSSTPKQLNNKLLKFSKKNKVIFQIEKQNKDNIPFLLPATLTYMNKYNSFSEKNRHEKLIDLYNKLIFFNENRPNNVYNYLKEYLLKNGITNDSMLKEDKLNQLKEYIFNEMHSVDSSKSIRDILIEGLNYSMKTKGDQCNKDNKEDHCLYMYLSRNISDKSIKKNPNMNLKNNSVNIEKKDLVLNMNMDKQQKIIKQYEQQMIDNNYYYKNKEFFINELKNDINDALKKRENRFSTMNKTVSNSFSFLTAHMNQNNNIHANSNVKKIKSPKRIIINKNEIQPFKLTKSRARSQMKRNRNYNINSALNNQSTNAPSNDINSFIICKPPITVLTKNVNQRLYYDYVNKDKTVNKINRIKQAMKFTEYIFYKQTQNRQCIEKVLKKFNIEDSI